MTCYTSKQSMQIASFVMYVVAFVLVLAVSLDACCGSSRKKVTMGLGWVTTILLLVGIILQGVAQFGNTDDSTDGTLIVY